MLYDASSKSIEMVASSQEQSLQDKLNEVPHGITKLSNLSIGEYDIDNVIFNIPSTQKI